MHPAAQKLIDELGLMPHPEGGHFCEVIRSSRTIEIPGQGPRSAITSIHFLLTRGERSRWHRVASDEVWIWLEGAPLELHVSDLREYTVEILQPPQRQHVVPAGHWQAARTRGEYSLVACVVAPGFDFADFELIHPDTEPGSEVARGLIALKREAADYL